jgi:LAO/AO transport system ATPase
MRQRKERTQRNSKQRDAARVHLGIAGDTVQRLADRLEPQRHVVSIEDRGRVSANCPRALKVVDCIERNAKPRDERRDSVQPEGDVPTCAMEKKDGGKRSGSVGQALVEPNRLSSAEKRGHAGSDARASATTRGIIADVDVTDLEQQARTMVMQMRAGNPRALARAITLVEDEGPGATELLAACAEFHGTSLRIGITGSPGAGKSTLVDQMVRFLRKQAKSVGVIAIDPSSPYTGGALLGDRIRMHGFAGDSGVFFRSMASRGAMGGLARGAANACAMMEAAGREVILIETVGTGQDEVEVSHLADVTVLVLVPGMGDDVQTLKAGIMEVADIFVVNKSDREGSDRVEQEILAMQSLSQDHPAWVPPVIRTNATSGEGIGALMAAIESMVAMQARGGQ